MGMPIARHARLVFATAMLLGLAGCGDKPAGEAAKAAPATSATAPDTAIRVSADLLKRGDIAGLMQHSMPPAEFARTKAEWNKDAADKPITPEDRQKFADTMARLTAPDADKALYAQIEPQLKAFDAQYQQQIPMYVTMGSSWLQGVVQQSKDLSDADKQQAMAAINTLGTWVQKTRFTDPDLVKKVLAIGTKAARDVNLKTLDEARALTFEQSMQKAQIAFLALKDALDVYGLSVDKTLDSVKTDVVANDGKAAQVKVSYTLLDAPLSVDTEMVNLDGLWYGKSAIDKLNEKKAEDAAPPATGTAPAKSPAPPTPPAKQG